MVWTGENGSNSFLLDDHRDVQSSGVGDMTHVVDTVTCCGAMIVCSDHRQVAPLPFIRLSIC